MTAIAETGRATMHEVWSFARTAAVEAAWNAYHLKRSLEQPRAIGSAEAQTWRDAFHQDLQDHPSDVFPINEPPVLGARLAAGFWFTVFNIDTEFGRLLLKIGHKYSPWYGLPHPSHKDYFDHYTEKLARQREVYDPHLPYLIPPQEVRYVHNGNRGTTIILETPISHGRRVTDFKSLSPANQKKIIEEYGTFIKLTRLARKKYKLLPDLVLDKLKGSDNLIIGQTPDGPHLVLIDNGVIDLTRNTPILNLLAPATTTFWSTSDRARCEYIYRRNSNQR